MEVHTCLWVVCIKQTGWKSNQQGILVFIFWWWIRARSKQKGFFWWTKNWLYLRDYIQVFWKNHSMEKWFWLHRFINITFRVLRITYFRSCGIKERFCDKPIQYLSSMWYWKSTVFNTNLAKNSMSIRKTKSKYRYDYITL